MNRTHFTLGLATALAAAFVGLAGCKDDEPVPTATNIEHRNYWGTNYFVKDAKTSLLSEQRGTPTGATFTNGLWQTNDNWSWDTNMQTFILWQPNVVIETRFQPHITKTGDLWRITFEP